MKKGINEKWWKCEHASGLFRDTGVLRRQTADENRNTKETKRLFVFTVRKSHYFDVFATVLVTVMLGLS